MSVKWTEADVIKAMNEALSPSQNGNGRANLIKQLTAKRRVLPVKKPLVVR